MRISDWSSDVCSSDLGCAVRGQNSVLGSLDRQPKPALPCNEAVGTWRTECLRNKLDDCLKARHPVCRSPVPVRLLANNNVRQLPESTFASLNGGNWTKHPIRTRLHPDGSIPPPFSHRTAS